MHLSSNNITLRPLRKFSNIIGAIILLLTFYNILNHLIYNQFSSANYYIYGLSNHSLQAQNPEFAN
jgi:hypothetical protein